MVQFVVFVWTSFWTILGAILEIKSGAKRIPKTGTILQVVSFTEKLKQGIYSGTFHSHFVRINDNSADASSPKGTP